MEIQKENKKAEELQRFIIKNNDLEGFFGDGKEILDIPELPIKHEFADQIYLRQMLMHEGQIVVGAIHNHEHVWFLMKGKITINDNGEVIDHIAPCYMVSKPGSKRIIYAHDRFYICKCSQKPIKYKRLKSTRRRNSIKKYKRV